MTSESISISSIIDRLRLVFAGIALVACGCANAHDLADIKDQICNNKGAPVSIAGSDVIIQIENTVTTLPKGYPYKGAVVTHYKKDGTFSADGTVVVRGDAASSEQHYFGTYKYQRTGANTATEKAFDESLKTPYVTKYTFETSTSGKWEQDFGKGQILFSGSFTIIPSDLPTEKHLTPQSISGLNVALAWHNAVSTQLSPDMYPTRGLAVQTYSADGTMVIKGYGAKTLDSHGFYNYKKISANVAVENVTQINNIFTLPYTMVYVFDTPNAGRWFQNLGDNLIKFTGTFETFNN